MITVVVLSLGMMRSGALLQASRDRDWIIESHMYTKHIITHKRVLNKLQLELKHT